MICRDNELKHCPYIHLNRPNVSGRYVFSIRHNDDFRLQLATDFNGVGSFRRVRTSGVWSDWVRIVDENGGNAVSANRLATPRTITLTGAVTGSVSFDGSTNVTVNTTLTNRVSTGNSDEEGNLYKAKIDQLQKEVDELKEIVAKLLKQY